MPQRTLIIDDDVWEYLGDIIAYHEARSHSDAINRIIRKTKDNKRIQELIFGKPL